MSDDLRVAAFDMLGSTPGALRTVIASLPVSLAEQPADGGWSPKDVVAHLMVSQQQGALARIRAVVEQDHPALPEYDEEAELRRSGFQSRGLHDLIEEFADTRVASVAWLRTLPVDAFSRMGEHSGVGPLTAEQLLYHAAYHDSLHLAQLARMIGSHFEPRRGGMRAF